MTVPVRDRVAILEGGKVTVGRQVDAVTARSVDAYVAAWASVRDDLVRAAAEAHQAAVRDGNLRSPAAYRTARLQRVLDELTAQLQRLGMQTGVQVTNVVAPVMEVPQEVLRELEVAGAPALNRVPDRELQAIIRRQQEAIASRYLVLSVEAEQGLRDALLRGISRGGGAESVARDMVRTSAATTAGRLGIGSAAELEAAPAAIVAEVRGAFAGGMQRAMVLARTELIDASRVATTASYLASPDVVAGWEWMATLDSRTCAACWAMHGQVFAPDVHQEGHQQCVPGGTLVAGPRASAATARPYQGRMLTVVTTFGHHLSVTPNHPILTARGWIPAGQLRVGDEVVSSTDPQRVAVAVNPDHHQAVARIKDVAGPLAMALGVQPVGMPGAPEQFHGDGLAQHQVQVVGAARDAVTVGDPAVEQGAQGGLVHASGCACPCQSSAHIRFGTATAAPYGDIRGAGQPPPFHERSLSHALPHSLTAVALPSAAALQRGDDRSPAHAEALRKRLHRLAGIVRRDYVRQVLIADDWRGHVYNLQTDEGWYLAEGIVVHNCRCTQSPLLTGERPGGNGLADRDAAFRELSRGEQLQVLGPQRLKAYEAGVPLTAMAQRRDNRGWRAGQYVTPVAQLPKPGTPGAAPLPKYGP